MFLLFTVSWIIYYNTSESLLIPIDDNSAMNTCVLLNRFIRQWIHPMEFANYWTAASVRENLSVYASACPVVFSPKKEKLLFINMPYYVTQTASLLLQARISLRERWVCTNCTTYVTLLLFRSYRYCLWYLYYYCSCCYCSFNNSPE